MSFQKAKSIFEKYFKLESEVKELEHRIKISNYENIFQKEFVICHIELLEEFLTKIILFKKEELLNLKKEFEWINLKVSK